MFSGLGKILTELFKPQTIFAFMFYSTFCILLLQQKGIPQELNTVVGVILGFYYGAKMARDAAEREKKNNGQ